MSTISTKPYLLRALYEWSIDSGYTPHIVAWVNEQTQVPMQYVRDNEIVLNIGPQAAHGLRIDNEWVHFAARFAGVSHDIWIPVGHVVSIFARETGEGMGFEVEPLESDADKETDADNGSHADTADSGHSDSTLPSDHTPDDTGGKKKGLRIVK